MIDVELDVQVLLVTILQRAKTLIIAVLFREQEAGFAGWLTMPNGILARTQEVVHVFATAS